MVHIGIDLGGKTSQICIRRSDGRILTEFPASTHRLVPALKEHPGSRVILETCSESFAVARELKAAGHDVRIVPATLVGQLGVGARKIKTDKRDARALSQVSTRVELPTVFIPSLESREVRATLSFRDHHVRCRTMLINAVRGWMRVRLIKSLKSTSTSFPKKVRSYLEKYHEGVPPAVELHLQAIENHTAAVKTLDAELDRLVEKSEIAQRLSRVVGVGPVCALSFISFIDTPHRFQSARDLYSYLGLTPSEKSSSTRKRVGEITKAGPAEMRKVLVQSAWSFWRSRPNDPLARWANQVAARRGRYVALVGMARKLGGILWAMWRDGTEYDPGQVSPHTAT